MTSKQKVHYDMVANIGKSGMMKPRRRSVPSGVDVTRCSKQNENFGNYLLTASLWSEHVSYPSAGEYYAQYTERYNRSPDYHGAEANSALLVAAEALKRSKSFSPQDTRDALNQIYIMTPFGSVKFYSYEDFERQNSVNTLVLRAINGKFETIRPLDAASARFVLPQ